MTINTNTNDNKDNNKINISINLSNPQPEIKKKKKYKKRKPRLSPEDRAKILGGGAGGSNYATQTPVNYLPKYSDRSLGGGNFFGTQPFDNNQRLALANPYQLQQALNGGIQIQPPQQQIQAPQFQPQQPPQIQQAPQFQPQGFQQNPQIINIDGIPDNRALYDPVNNQYMRPEMDRFQVVDAVDYVPDFESRPTTSGSNPPRPNRPPPPLPPPEDNFEDALDPSQDRSNLPQNDIVFTGEQREKITCECSCKICKNYLSRHLKSKKHLNYLVSNTK